MGESRLAFFTSQPPRTRTSSATESDQPWSAGDFNKSGIGLRGTFGPPGLYLMFPLTAILIAGEAGWGLSCRVSAIMLVLLISLIFWGGADPRQTMPGLWASAAAHGTLLAARLIWPRGG